MGVGATLAFGCNIGGFFSAVSALSLAGFAMMLGLGVGAFLGLRYLLWETAHRPGWSSGRGRTWARARRDASRQPLAGLLLLAALVAAPFAYAAAGHPQRGLFLLFGAAFGVIFQRSRFCLVRAFREPFMTGDAEHTRAAALALVVSTLGFAILKFTDLKDKGDWVFAAAGVGGLLRHPLRYRHDARRRLRRGLDLARGRGAGETLGGRRVLRVGRVRRAAGPRRRARQARRRRVPAGGRRLGRDAAARDGGGRCVGARGDVERGHEKIRRTGLNRCTLPSQSSDRGSSRGTSWHG